MISLQAFTDNQCQLLQSTSENANLYCEPYQNQAEQSYNQWNKERYWSNYPQPTYSQQSRVYYSKITDQYDQFKNYENDYYNNDQFKQEDDWVNHIIDEDWTVYEAYEEASEVNENIDINHAVEQAAYHCCWCSEFFSSNNSLHKHVRFSHNLSNIKASWALNSESEPKPAYFTITNEKLNKELVQSNTTAVSVKGYEF